MTEKFIAEMIELYPFFEDYPIAFDFGANEGDYTEALASKFSRVYAFEPFPENLEILRKRFSGVDNVTIVPKAVHYKNGKTKFFTNGKNDQGSLSTVFAQANSWEYSQEKFIEVESITLDDFCKQENVPVEQIGFMKIDIEGAEYSFLKGALKTLRGIKNNKTWLVLEAHMLVDWEVANELLREEGFSFWSSEYKAIESIGPGDHYLLHKGNISFKIVCEVEN